MKIIVDAMGGDNAPLEIVKGALQAQKRFGADIVFTGDEAAILDAVKACDLTDLRPGDLVQLSFNGEEFQHTPVVVRVTAPITLDTVLIAAHSYDADNRPLSTYTFQDIRFLHVLGTIRP